MELLSPAGSFKGFLGAVNAGCDAVYLGGTRFGARAYAENFTDEEIIKAIEYAHLFGGKAYLTVNT
jgi:putative protease